MRIRLAVGTTALALAACAATQLHAQSVEHAELVPFAGYMVFGDLLRGPLGTTLSNSNGTVFGAQLGLHVAGPVSVYGSGAFSRSDLTVGVPFLGGVAVGRTDAWLADAGLQFEAATAGPVAPLVQAGVGAVRYDISNGPLRTRSTNAVLAFGAGIDVDLGPVGLRLMARDHVGRFDFQQAAFVDIEGRTAHHVSLIAGLRFGM
jgi:Outer membrane protein beta-barrel domain